jgi:hypothetical protein
MSVCLRDAVNYNLISAPASLNLGLLVPVDVVYRELFAKPVGYTFLPGFKIEPLP